MVPGEDWGSLKRRMPAPNDGTGHAKRVQIGSARGYQPGFALLAAALELVQRRSALDV
jgi:hypothetical protein